jgi:hypothetical protein
MFYMYQYYDSASTPLKFHKFFRYVLLPVNFLTGLISLVSEPDGMPVFSWLYAVDIGYFLIMLSLILVCFIGFFGWQSYAWYGVFAYLGVNLLYTLFTVALYALYISDTTRPGVIAGQFFGAVAYAVLVGIYYIKRRPLFFPNPVRPNTYAYVDAANTAQSGVSGSTVTTGVPGVTAAPAVKYCRQCGYELLPGSNFCTKCGTPVAGE